MKRALPLIAAMGFVVCASSAFAQGAGGNPATGTGGAKEQMLPSTVGVDPRPDRETMKSRRPGQQATEATAPAPRMRKMMKKKHRRMQ